MDLFALYEEGPGFPFFMPKGIVILAFLKRAELFPLARIIDAGGRFILLLPAVPRVEALLPAFADEVQAWFLDEFKGRLSLNLSHAVRMSEKDFELAVFSRRLDEFFDQLEARKMRKFSSLLEAGRSPVAGRT